MSDQRWTPGQRLVHRYNEELGPGIVLEVSGRSVVVHFPNADETLRFSTDSDAIEPLVYEPGARALLGEKEEQVVVAESLKGGELRLADGRVVSERDLWPEEVGVSLVERLAGGDVDKVDEVSTRLESLHLSRLREADGLGSFLGGRIRLFPHQLFVSEQATRRDPVRWLLADEVGLGKTVEACLITNHLVRTGRADRVLVVAPETLTVQWLGELWRKFHQVFVLLDDKRIADVKKDFGQDFSPFDAYERVVLGIETLVANPWLVERAVESGIDLLVVDEAHHLHRPPGHPGNAEYRAIAPIAALGRHVLLLSATPLAEDAQGFFRLLQLLRPEEFEDEFDAEALIASGRTLPACVSSTRRADIGDMQPRFGRPIELQGWSARRALERAIATLPEDNALEKRRKADSLRRALASGPSIEAILPGEDRGGLRRLAQTLSEDDPRIDWLAQEAGSWRDSGEKTLVFVAERETLELLRSEMSRRAQLRTGVFHEDLSPGQRDIEVAQFRLASGPSMLVSTECGGEGRNFEFCTRLVLFDLPWSPVAVEQRIGRLDRIGRDIPVEIVYFVDGEGFESQVVDVYERIGLFREPLGSIEPELLEVESALRESAVTQAGEDGRAVLDAAIERTHAATKRVREAAWREMHRDPYARGMAEAILQRVPEELEDLTEEVILGVADQLRLKTEELRGEARWAIEFGTGALLDSLPGVPAGSAYSGSFSREEAVADEMGDFFASGHPMVEALLAHEQDSPAGRVGLVETQGDPKGFGLVALYREGDALIARAVDLHGKRHGEWEELVLKRPLRSRRVQKELWVKQKGWPDAVRRMAVHLPEDKKPLALVALRVL